VPIDPPEESSKSAADTATAKSQHALRQHNSGDNEVENRADHHAAHSAEQHEDVGLTKQHPDHQSPDEGAKDAGDREAPGKPDVTSLTHVMLSATARIMRAMTRPLAISLDYGI